MSEIQIFLLRSFCVCGIGKSGFPTGNTREKGMEEVDVVGPGFMLDF